MTHRIMASAATVALIALAALGTGSDLAVAQSGARSLPELEWNMTLKKFNFDDDKFIGQRFTAKCPPFSVRDKDDVVYGTDVYPSNNAICVAAVHAGKIDRNGGTVTVQLNPGASEYAGSGRNGVETQKLPGTPRSMVFIDASNAGEPDEVRFSYIPRLKWDTKFTSTTFARKMFTGQRFAFNCPAAPANLTPRYVFGTDSYAFHSVVCRAAVHAGTITPDGGLVYVQIDPGKDKLVGSIRNGIESKDAGTQHHTISFVDDQP